MERVQRRAGDGVEDALVEGRVEARIVGGGEFLRVGVGDGQENAVGADGDRVFGMADLGLRDRFQSRQQRVRILVSELADLLFGGERR